MRPVMTAEDADRRRAGEPVPAEIAGLDFTPALEYDCDCNRCDGHIRPCRGTGTLVMTVHAVHHCKNPLFTSDGGVVAVLCPRCVFSRTKRAAEFANQLQDYIKEGRQPVCRTCGKNLGDMNDFIEIKAVNEI
jgi:hypothetical protein